MRKHLLGLGWFLAALSIRVAGLDAVLSAIADGSMVSGSVEFSQRKLYIFAAPPIQSLYPTVEITLNILSLGGRADLFCTTGTNYEENKKGRRGNETVKLLGPEFYMWRTDYAEKIESIQIPAEDVQEEAERTGVLEPQYVCSVVGMADPDISTEFLLDLVLEYTTPVLVEEERRTMLEIFQMCCKDEKKCERWPRQGTHFPTPVFDDDDDLTDGSSLEVTGFEMDEVFLDFCHVRGCECNTEGRLKALDMDFYGLECEFPGEQLQRLEGLEILLLTGNALSGDLQNISQSLSKLRGLKWLELKKNSLVGSMVVSEDSAPANAFCNLVSGNLEYLNLAGNIITGRVPGCVFSGSLTHFAVDDNLLTGVLPKDINSKSPMTLFTAHENRLSGPIPEQFSRLQRLEHLQLSTNLLSGTLPVSVTMLPRLVRLLLDNNMLTGKIPHPIAESGSLAVVRLNSNGFTHLPDRWDHSNASPALTVLDISDNQIVGPFPMGLGRALNLTSLGLAGNMLHGTLPQVNWLFPKANRLQFQQNHFIGPIPEEFFTLGMFQGGPRPRALPPIPILDLSYNKLTGVIPAFLDPNSYNFPNRLLVYLEGNNLTCGDEFVGERGEGDKVFGVECNPIDDVGGHHRRSSTLASTVAAVALPVLAAFTIVLMFFVKRRHDVETQAESAKFSEMVSSSRQARAEHAPPHEVWLHRQRQL